MNKFPKGWDKQRVQRVLDHYESQTEDEAVAEDTTIMRKKTQKRHKIFQILLQKLIEDGQYDTEDMFVLVELAKDWKLDFAEQAAAAGVSDKLESVPGVKPIGPPPKMPPAPIQTPTEAKAKAYAPVRSKKEQ